MICVTCQGNKFILFYSRASENSCNRNSMDKRIFTFSAKTNEAVGKIKTIREIKKRTNRCGAHTFLLRYRSSRKSHTRFSNEQYPKVLQKRYLDNILKNIPVSKYSDIYFIQYVIHFTKWIYTISIVVLLLLFWIPFMNIVTNKSYTSNNVRRNKVTHCQF